MTTLSPAAPQPGGPFTRLKTVFNDYPRQFWVLIGASFIDHLGGALLFPFFSLYVTRKFAVGMTEVGILFAMFSLTGLISSFFGGALTDRLGRKGILIFGLVMSALSALLMGLVNDFRLFVLIAALVGLLADVGGPAQSALVADILPEKKRAEGYGILRVVFNLAVVIGPMVGGLLAARSYLLLFVIDAILSTTTAVLVFFFIQETRQPAAADEPQESLGQTFRGYLTVLRDSVFTAFLLASMLSTVMYMQMNTTLAVFLRDVHGVPERGFGYILSLNAAMVVLMQFPVTRVIRPFRPMMVMVVGTLLYAIGFGMYGFVNVFPLFLAAMVVITLGEMLVSPVAQAIVSRMAPEAMRGRYMATYGFSWVIPSAVGPLLAGLVMDNVNPRWVFWGAGLVGLAATAAFYWIERRVSSSAWDTLQRRLNIIERLEENQISAAEATHQLEQIDVGRWALLATQAAEAEPTAQRQLHIRVSHTDTGSAHTELHLPVGLVNTILNTGGRLSHDLDEFDPALLRRLIAESVAEGATGEVNGAADPEHRVAVSLD
jgi:MFS family permease